ncbi:MAG: argininosuccinate lyase [Thermoflexales bacterium]|nr:argininosuccinate lyase [Thermoflexales bacterium]
MGTFPHPLYRRLVLEPTYAGASRHLFEPMLAANRAHVRMLARQGLIEPACRDRILEALKTIEDMGIEAFPYRPPTEDLFFAIEGKVIELAGPDCGGNLQLARSRNDLGAALGRMALRELQGRLIVAQKALRRVILSQARAHLGTLMPGHTHTQPAQPTTFAHYLMAVASALARDTARMEQARKVTNRSPLGAAAFTTTGFPIDRESVAKELGFEGLMVNAHDAIGAADHYLQTASALQIMASTLSRFCHDLLIMATREVGALTVDDSFIQISSIMPQKRNPVVLEHLRARLAQLYGGAQTVFVQAHNVFYGDTQDIEDEMHDPFFALCETALDCLDLLTETVSTLNINTQVLAARAAAGFTTATELADALVRERGYPFRSAHGITSRVVRTALAAGLEPADVTADMINAAIDAQGLPRPTPPIDADFARRALDPALFVASRNVMGGVGRQAAEAMLTALETELAAS